MELRLANLGFLLYGKGYLAASGNLLENQFAS